MTPIFELSSKLFLSSDIRGCERHPNHALCSGPIVRYGLYPSVSGLRGGESDTLLYSAFPPPPPLHLSAAFVSKSPSPLFPPHCSQCEYCLMPQPSAARHPHHTASASEYSFRNCSFDRPRTISKVCKFSGRGCGSLLFPRPDILPRDLRVQILESI